MDRMNDASLREAFVKEVTLNNGKAGSVPTLSDFCDWIRRQSTILSPTEYLTKTSDTVLDLCVSIKVSKMLPNAQSKRMAGNIYLLSHSLTDVLEEWRIAIGGDEGRKKQEIRDKLEELIDALQKFDQLFSWTEFSSWLLHLTQQTNKQNQPQVRDLRGTVDFAIITIRQDEFEAVLKRFPNEYQVFGRRYYSVGNIGTVNGGSYRVAVTRCTFQGVGEARCCPRHYRRFRSSLDFGSGNCRWCTII